MKYSGTLIAVSNMDISKHFYVEVLGLKVINDCGAHVILENGFFLQTCDSWKNFIKTDQIQLQNNAYELYFEEADFDAFIKHLNKYSISYIHEPMEQSWGQMVVRFYDPDHHIIEVAEEINSVVKRYIDHGMTIEETAKRMDVPVDYVIQCLN